jgi:ubiquinone/menaquinone biosynthesis C-methylase UbiE
MNAVVEHYAISDLTERIASALRDAGKDLAHINAADLAAIDEFHVRGRSATLELAERMELTPGCCVLDIGSGLGGPARTLAEVHGCRVTGIDLSPVFCETARHLSQWAGLNDKVDFVEGDATSLPFEAGTFDAAMSIHVAMNIEAKSAIYSNACRSLKPGRIFAVFDILQGEGGDVAYPVPWARDASISYLVTPGEMRNLLEGAGFRIEAEEDSTEASETWFKQAATKMNSASLPPLSLRQFLGNDGLQMTQNQVRNLAERRIRTVTYICRRS